MIAKTLTQCMWLHVQLAQKKSWTVSNEKANLYEVPTFVVVILSLFYGIISLTAFVGNSLVIYVVVVSR